MRTYSSQFSSSSGSWSERLRRHRGQLFLLAALALLTFVLGARGAEFYALDVASRVDHPDFRVLSPSSPVGNGYGIAGTVLILTNLLYLARRRFARLHLGSMRTWLHIHVFTGLFGSTLVVFHSAFQLRSGVAALTAVSLGVVIVTGLVGRYFYGLAPEADVGGLLRALQALDALSPGLARRLMNALEALPEPTQCARASLRQSLATLPTWLRERSQRVRIIREGCAPLFARGVLEPSDRREAQRLCAQAMRLAADQVNVVAGAHLLRSWRGLHRFMALLMILLVMLHIGVAWVLGYRFAFGE